MREALVYADLSADASVTAVVGSSPVRIFPDIAELGTAAPYVVYTLVSVVPDSLMQSGSGIDNLRVQLDCYAQTKSSSVALQLTCRTALEAAGWYCLSGNPSGRDLDSGLYRSSADYENVIPI